MGTYLIPRPKRQAQATAKLLQAMGHKAIISPVLEIQSTDMLPPTGPFDAVAFSSGSSISALHGHEALPDLLDLPCFTVGDKTAALATEVGFQHVQSAQGNSQDLAQLITTQWPEIAPVDGGALLYCCGEQRNPGLEALLSSNTIAFEVWENYSSELVNQLSDESLENLRSDRVDGVLLYSSRMAIQIGRLLKQNLTDKQLKKLTYYAISNTVKDAFEANFEACNLPLCIVSASPDEAALLNLLND